MLCEFPALIFWRETEWKSVKNGIKHRFGIVWISFPKSIFGYSRQTAISTRWWQYWQYTTAKYMINATRLTTRLMRLVSYVVCMHYAQQTKLRLWLLWTITDIFKFKYTIVDRFATTSTCRMCPRQPVATLQYFYNWRRKHNFIDKSFWISWGL